MQKEHQAEQTAWKRDRQTFSLEFKGVSDSEPAKQKRFKALRNRKKTLDSSARSLNDDVRQLNAIQTWIDRSVTATVFTWLSVLLNLTARRAGCELSRRTSSW